jgi:pectin methylesterase-like acyl-CoA thioesterase
MLSYQDTYYTDNEKGQTYLENAEIHGTVDFICGAGDTYFNRCTIVTERRNRDGSGRTVIAAPRTDGTPWGYVFESCTIYNRMSDFVYARGWKIKPHCTWLNTMLMSPEKLQASRFDPRGMSTIDSKFQEYHTMDAQGRDITPQTNVVTFTLNDDKNTVETILTAEKASRYELEKIFPDWRPEKIVRKLTKHTEWLKQLLW